MQIDGSMGEGGGQLLRTALSLAALTRREVEIVNIRANRQTPGIQPGHLAAIRALAAIADAKVEGAATGSQRLKFSPGVLQCGDFTFNASDHVRDPGSVGSLVQAIAPALMAAPGRSTVTIHGGTHYPGSPTVTYLQTVFLPTVRKFGFRGDISLDRWGWPPTGTGTIRLVVERPASFRGIDMTLRGELLQIGGIAVVSGDDPNTGSRQRDRAHRRIAAMGRAGQLTVQSVTSEVPGNMVFLLAVFERSIAGFTSIATPGEAAEKVTDHAVDELVEYLQSYSVLDKHLADQLIVYAAAAAGETAFSTCEVTPHLLTSIELVRQFLRVHVELDGRLGQPADVRIMGAQRR